MRYVLEFAIGMLVGYGFGAWQQRRLLRSIGDAARAANRWLLADRVRERLK